MIAFDIVLVGAGGGIGSLLRWWIGRLVGEKYHGKFRYRPLLLMCQVHLLLVF